MIASIIAIVRYCVIAVGLFIGFYYYSPPDVSLAVGIVTLTCAGVVGILSFFSHVVFHASDARRLGLESGQSSFKFFQFEVGFANLAIGIMAVAAFAAGWAP